MKKRFYCICIQASSKTEEDRKSLRVFSSLMEVLHAIFAVFLSLLLHSLPTPTSLFLLPYFPKATQKANWKRKERKNSTTIGWQARMQFIWNSPSYLPPPRREKERKNSSTTGRQPRMEFTNLSLVLNLSLLLTKPIIWNIVRMKILIVVMLRSLYELGYLSGSQLKLEQYRED